MLDYTIDIFTYYCPLKTKGVSHLKIKQRVVATYNKTN